MNIEFEYRRGIEMPELVEITEWLFVTPEEASDPKWTVIKDPKVVRGHRKLAKKFDRQIRNAQRRGERLKGLPHRHAPHGRHRILVMRRVS